MQLSSHTLRVTRPAIPNHMGAPALQPVRLSGNDSGKKIAERIKGLIKGYVGRGFDCKKVILVTHSMGGLVARAMVHPDYVQAPAFRLSGG